jgi:hypothetical protein
METAAEFYAHWNRRSELFDAWQASTTNESFKTWLAERKRQNPGLDIADYDITGF